MDSEQHQVPAGCRLDRHSTFCVSLAAFLVLVDADKLFLNRHEVVSKQEMIDMVGCLLYSARTVY
jgi:hypothetical protein